MFSTQMKNANEPKGEKNREGRRGNYLEKENVCLSRKRKREKEKDKNIWISKYFLVGGGGGGGEGGEGGGEGVAR